MVTGTVISSSTFNSLTADLGTGLSTAITKDGQTTTTAKIPFAQGLSAAVASNFAAGTVGAPSIYLSTDTTTGLYRIGANNVGFAVSGVKLLDLGSALVGITGALTVSTTLGVTGTSTLAAVNTSGSILAASGGNYLTTGAAPVYIGGRSTTGDGYIGVNVKVGVGNYVVNGFAGQIYYDTAGAWNFSTAASGTAGNAVSDTNKMSISNAGAVTMPAQPSFFANLSATATNVTGDATAYTIICNTELFDRASNYNNATGVFTAPITGIYQFNATAFITDIQSTQNNFDIYLQATARNYHGSGNATALITFQNLILNFSGLIPLTSGDTVSMVVVVAGGTKTADVLGSSTPYTHFSGFLVA